MKMNHSRWLIALPLVVACNPDRHANYCESLRNPAHYDASKPVVQCETLDAMRKRLEHLDWNGYGEILSVDDGPHFTTPGEILNCCYGVTYKDTGY